MTTNKQKTRKQQQKQQQNRQRPDRPSVKKRTHSSASTQRIAEKTV